MRHSIRSNTPDDPHDRERPRLPPPDQGLGRSESIKERAVLATVLLPDTKADFRDPLGELASLAESAGVEVVDRLMQKRTHLSPSTAMGKGKLYELQERIEANEANVLIFDNALSPRQIRGIEKVVACKVIDRSELILDIFAARARTREAQLQVELAQLEYTAPRIRGMWTHLERLAGAGGPTAAGAVGGVGTRGPGERQIEIDRRIVQKRITHLRQQISDIDHRKEREVLSRKDVFSVALVGYTNSGKTTLLNTLTGTSRYAADKLFATLDTKTVRWELGEGKSVLLSDTVGFVRDLPHHLVASFRATLEEAIHADLLLQVVDMSSPIAFQQIEAVDEVLDSLGCSDIPQLTLLNKMDIANETGTVEMLARHRSGSLQISAKLGDGLNALADDVRERLEGDTVSATLRLRQQDGRLLAELARVAEVQDRRYENQHVELVVRINRDRLSQLVGRHENLEILSGDVTPPQGNNDGEWA